MTILTVGESVLDIVESLDGTVTAHPGGSPANVAVGLSRLGQQATFLTELGDDAPGRQILAHLTQAGVTTIRAPSGHRTPTARAIVGADGAATYDFDIAWTFEADVPAGASHVHTGSIACHLDPGAPAVERVVAAARERATVSYDPNVRETLVGDHADVVARTERMIALADVVKASDEDIAWLYPHHTVEQVLRAWTASTPLLAVATLGAAGSLACLRGELITVAPIAVTVADTVGAGDSYMAALIDGLARAGLLGPAGRTALEAVDASTIAAVVTRAARAAAITVSRAGANPPTLDQLDAPQPDGGPH